VKLWRQISFEDEAGAVDMKTEIMSNSDLDAQAGLNKLRLVRNSPPALPNPVIARVAVVGLGYVGLPLICGFSKNSTSIGFDIDRGKVDELKNGIDHTGEVTASELLSADAVFTTDSAELEQADVIVVCVPTPVNARNQPDYSALLSASRMIGQNMKKGAVVVFESTVDPGTTEDRCLPLIEEASGFRESIDFYLGYSPERINPADPTRKLSDIKKIVAGTSPFVTEFLVKLYGRVVAAGLFPAANIKVAEAAKILENTQRDVNIALMNQMMTLYDKMGIRSTDVIAAASSKWNFHHYRPGLVGGHCIAVDPYYLIDAGRRHGLPMDLIVAARATNEATPYFLVEKLEELFEQNATTIQNKRVLVLGRSFKEDCPDTRNSKTFKMMDYLWTRGAEVFNFDPVAEDDHFEGGRGTTFIGDPLAEGEFDAIIVTLSHSVFYEQFDLPTLASMATKNAPLIDMRGMFDCAAVEDHFSYWRP